MAVPMSLDDLRGRINAIEEGYEFFLAYAAQGLAEEAVGKAGEQIRSYLRGFDQALDGLAEAFRERLLKTRASRRAGAADPGGACGAAEAAEAALELLRRDAEASRALVRLVAVQPAISSQLVDNLNASIHVRALLTDVFVLGELVGA